MGNTIAIRLVAEANDRVTIDISLSRKEEIVDTTSSDPDVPLLVKTRCHENPVVSVEKTGGRIPRSALIVAQRGRADGCTTTIYSVYQYCNGYRSMRARISRPTPVRKECRYVSSQSRLHV